MASVLPMSVASPWMPKVLGTYIPAAGESICIVARRSLPSEHPNRSNSVQTDAPHVCLFIAGHKLITQHSGYRAVVLCVMTWIIL